MTQVDVSYSCIGCGQPVTSVYGRGADERLARKLCVSCWISDGVPAPAPEPPPAPPVCASCWRGPREGVPLQRVEEGPTAGFDLCAQCRTIAASWFVHGGGSESSAFGRRTLARWTAHTARREAYARGAEAR